MKENSKTSDLTKKEIDEIRASIITQFWEESKSHNDYAKRMHFKGCYIGRGDKAKYTVVDGSHWTGSDRAQNLMNYLPDEVRVRDVDKRLGISYEHLPSTQENINHYRAFIKKKREKKQQKSQEKEGVETTLDQKEQRINHQVQKIKDKRKNRSQGLER